MSLEDIRPHFRQAIKAYPHLEDQIHKLWRDNSKPDQLKLKELDSLLKEVPDGDN